METLKPALRVLAHAEMRGAQIGSAAGLVLVLPRSLSCGKAATVGGAACMAGAGMLLGGAACGVYAAVQMLRKDKSQIKEKADKICGSVKPAVDKASHSFAAIGVAYAVKRLIDISKAEDIAFVRTLGSKRGAWIIISYAALGVGTVVLSAAVAKGGHMAVKKIKERMSQKGEDDDEAAEAAAGVVNGVATAAAAVAEKVEKSVDTSTGDKTA